jgi:hypothetical protein
MQELPVIFLALSYLFLLQEMEAKKKQEAEKRLADKRGGREASNSAIVPLER